MVTHENIRYECMTAAGFRYAKVDWAAIDAEIAAASQSMAEEDYMPIRGYGMADSLDTPEVIESAYVDPNDEIRGSLSEGELAAWKEQDFECKSQAQMAVVVQPRMVYHTLQDELQILREHIDADARIAAATLAWSACMADQGHHYANQEEIFEYLSGFADPLVERLRAIGGPDNIDAAFQADLDALQAMEVEIAVADLACKKHLEQVIYEVIVEHEERFLEEHEDRLALLREELPTMDPCEMGIFVCRDR